MRIEEKASVNRDAVFNRGRSRDLCAFYRDVERVETAGEIGFRSDA